MDHQWRSPQPELDRLAPMLAGAGPTEVAVDDGAGSCRITHDGDDE